MESLTDRFPVVVILVALGTAAYALVERAERRREDRRRQEWADHLERLGRGTGGH